MAAKHQLFVALVFSAFPIAVMGLPQNIETSYPFMLSTTYQSPPPEPAAVKHPSLVNSKLARVVLAVMGSFIIVAVIMTLFLIMICKNKKKQRLSIICPLAADEYPRLRRVNEKGLDKIHSQRLGRDGFMFKFDNVEEKRWIEKPNNPPIQELPLDRKRSCFSEMENRRSLILVEIKELPPPPPTKRAQASPPLPPPSMRSTAAAPGRQIKLKPLHWDKVNPNNVDHSMVWHRMNNGSFVVDDEKMEALFGYSTTNRRSLKKTNQTSQIFILDPRKSQNIAIILRSLAVSGEQIAAALLSCHGLNPETLETLQRIAPTIEEEAQILEFNQDLKKLADSESFLYHLLKSIPSAFSRINVLLFQSTFRSEVNFLRESLQTLELACGELRNRGLFSKLLEAILKAGNRMNAGTPRGNAQAFSLTSLKKLSDVKSIDGTTTLLYFVVEEVVRAEGKRRRIKDENCILLGLPFVVGGIKDKLENVKKSACLDFDGLVKIRPALAAGIAEVRRVIEKEEGVFEEEMRGFVESGEEELRRVKEEEEKVMEIVKMTREYYQGGGSVWKEKESNPLEIFGIVRDFLDMVHQTCIHIAMNMEIKKKSLHINVGE